MFVNMIFKINLLNEATKWIFKGVHTNYEILMQQIIERTVIVEGLMFTVEVTFQFKTTDYKVKMWKLVKFTHLNCTWNFTLVK